MLSILIAIVLIILLLYAIFLIFDTYNKYKSGYLSFQNVEFENVYPRIKFSMFADQEGQFALSRNNAQKFGKSYRQWFFRFGVIFHCIRAKDAEKILTSPTEINKGFAYDILRPFLNDGLVTSRGAKWFKRRRIITPAFHFNILQQFFVIFKEHCQQFVENLKHEVGRKDGSNINSLAAQFSMKSLGESALGVKLDNSLEFQNYRKSLHYIGKIFVLRVFKPWLNIKFVSHLFGYEEKFQESLKTVHTFTRNIIDERRKTFEETFDQNNEDDDENIYLSKKKRFALLDTLLSAEKRGELNYEGICEEINTFIFAGHDSISLGVTFILFLLAQHPEVQKKVLQEKKDTLEWKKSENLDFNDFSNMKYLDCVIKECLRIYPPATFIGRRLAEDFEINGLVLPKGASVRVHIFDIHRDPSQYPNPEVFDPDRFLPENVAKRHPYSFIPFSAGPRNCVGQKFAFLQLKIAVVDILQKFELIPVTKPEEIVFLMDITLKTKDPIKIKFKLRE